MREWQRREATAVPGKCSIPLLRITPKRNAIPLKEIRPRMKPGPSPEIVKPPAPACPDGMAPPNYPGWRWP